MEKTNEKHSEKPVGREGRWVKTTANLFCVRPCAEQLMGGRVVPSNGRSCFGAHTFLSWLGLCCFLCWVLDDTKPLLFMLAAHGRLQAVRIKLQFRICCPGQIRNKIHTSAASVSMPHEHQGFVYNGRIKFCSFWCLHVCMGKTGSVGLILRGVWSSFLVLMLWAVLLDALFFTSISAAAKQLWPFCVTGDFPQALTNCYSLSSPICHLKCYLENVNWSYNAVEWRDGSPHAFLSSSQMIDSQIRENGNLNRLCVVENVFPN